jgi:hypothetical protein
MTNPSGIEDQLRNAQQLARLFVWGVAHVAGELQETIICLYDEDLIPGAVEELERIHRGLLALVRQNQPTRNRLMAAERFGRGLESLAQDLRDTTMCFATLVASPPVLNLISVAGRLSNLLRWWNTVRGREPDFRAPPWSDSRGRSPTTGSN